MNGKRHRIDGPAIDCRNGNKEWYLNGKLHRTDGPAIIRANGTKYWYLNGVRHRTDGPAIKQKNGFKEWWLNGIEITYLRSCLKRLVARRLLRQNLKRAAQKMGAQVRYRVAPTSWCSICANDG